MEFKKTNIFGLYIIKPKKDKILEDFLESFQKQL